MKSKKIPSEGAVSVNGDITPITRQQIDKINGDGWINMSLMELHHQRAMLIRRYNSALVVGLYEPAKQILKGVELIDQILEEKEDLDIPGIL